MSLPSLYFTTADHPVEQAFDMWRTLMAPMYDIKPYSQAGQHPGGRTVVYLLDDILANRTYFTAQHVTRSRKLAESTPDHILFQLWQTGGYFGEIERHRVDYGAGTVALADRRRTFDVRFLPADTVGVIVPRAHFAGLDLESSAPRFDPPRSRLLQARISDLYRRLPMVTPGEVPALRSELVAFLRRILDPSAASDVLEGRELDRGLFAMAERFVAINLDRADLTAEAMAGALGISRATLYRLFVPFGGVMQFVREQRLFAIRNALMDPLERRTIGRVAASFGVHSGAYLSRTFRARFDASPREWRQLHREQARMRSVRTHEPFWRWFYGLGRKEGAGGG